MAPPHLAVLGTWDFSAFVRVGADDGLDPYSQSFEEPAFSDAPLGEGTPLINVSIKSREQVFPLFLGSSTSPLNKDQLHALQRTAALACKAASTLQWKDSGATDSTFFDTDYARFEPAFHYRRSQKGWLAGVLRVFSAPPYGHTGTWVQLPGGSALASGLTVTLPFSPTLGDAPGQLNVQIGMGSLVADREEGRLTGMTVVPSGRQVVYPAASLPLLMPNGTIIADGLAVGSLVMRRIPGLAIPEANDYFTRLDLAPASLFAGRQRIIALARDAGAFAAGPPAGEALWAEDTLGNRLGPVAQATSVFGFGAVDLGVLNVSAASGQATVSAFVLAGDGVWIDRFLVLPEDSTSYLLDNEKTLLTQDEVVASGATVDDLGVAYATPPFNTTDAMLQVGANGFQAPSAAMGSYGRRAIAMGIDPQRDMRVTAFTSTLNTGFPSLAIWAGKYDTRNTHTYTAQLSRVNATSLTLAILRDHTDVWASMAIPVPVVNGPWDVEFRSVGPQLRARVLFTGSVVASLGAATSSARVAAIPYIGLIASGAVLSIGRQHTLNIPSAPFVPRDVYALGPSEAAHYDSAGVFGRSLDQFRRARHPAGSVGAQQVVAFNLPLGNAPDNDAISASLRVRERFTFAR